MAILRQAVHTLPPPKDVVSVQVRLIMLIVVVLAFAKNAMARRNTMTPRMVMQGGWIHVSYAKEQENVRDAMGLDRDNRLTKYFLYLNE